MKHAQPTPDAAQQMPTPMIGHHFIELSLADGEEMDIPAAAITHIEGMSVTKNESFPDAKCFIRYTLAGEDHRAWLTQTFNDLLRLLDINVRPGNWLLLTRDNGDRLAFLKGNVISRKSVTRDDASCEITVLLTSDSAVGTYAVKESRDEIKGKMEQPAMSLDAPPPGLIEQPVPGTPAAKPAPRPRQRRKAQ